MRDLDFSDEFCTFLQKTVSSLEALELILVLSGDAEHTWSAAELSMKLRPSFSISESEVTRQLETFCAGGILKRCRNGTVRYEPASESVAEPVQTLREAYVTRPVTLLRMIYALRDSAIRSFADAFRLGRK